MHIYHLRSSPPHPLAPTWVPPEDVKVHGLSKRMVKELANGHKELHPLKNILKKLPDFHGYVTYPGTQLITAIGFLLNRQSGT